MDRTDFLFGELKSRFGTVKRARGNFLYTASGVRLTDLYREGGRAVLGWPSQESAVTVFKNVLSRGITGSYITDFTYALDKAVSMLFNSSRRCIAFSFKEDACAFAEEKFSDSFVWFRPWNTDVSVAEKSCILFEPVFPWAENTVLACIDSDWKGFEGAVTERSVQLSAPLCAAVTRSVYNLIKALQVYEEKNWFLYDTVLNPYFTRKGPWLYSKIPEDSYDEFVLHCLDCHIVVSPDPDVLSAVPFGVQKGVFDLLKKNPFGRR
ncbi:hypothetical protein HNP77_002003 [Treponema rectale]|uniref:Uncharacterized protein n=1 Tax=Treponema rectale TaxID=744512 RepID=A0A840SJS6_9SPIR|nr:hypothetical protein [Treponema rectale]MBB5219621.1 hypothetical protein [Treponema rectale]